ncbi:hypothetical protein ACIRBY_23325 [Streptomyces sp. NPDC096136]|uniref:hypothetical protein n=1 Tax=Streptomyces sp. NPDC096136 TaxID=3366076 RepID=UPI00380899BA
MTGQPTRHTVDTITSDALDELYARIDTLTAVCRSNKRAYAGAVADVQAAEQRAEQAEAALARVRQLASNWIVLRTHGGAAYELRAALDPQGPQS